MIDIKEAVILGIIQGLTEFIPISSTAHLKIIPSFLGMKDPGAAYSAVIQLGTLISLLIYFFKDIMHFAAAAIRGIIEKKPFENTDTKMVWYLMAGTIPISVAGLLFTKFITGPARSLYVISGSLIGLAIILFIADQIGKRKREVKDITFLDAILIGIAQAMALIPGSSRSGTTLTMGLFLGFTREAAMRFSFLLSIPAIALSGFYELIKEREHLADAGFTGLIVGTLVSAVVGYAAVAGLLKFLKSNSVFVFVAYRIMLGLVILYLLIEGILQP